MSNQENISKETKKTRRKKSQRKAQQIKLAVIMIMVSVLVLSASTFAWYKMSKTANVQNMEFKADTLGNLLISETVSGSYNNSLDLGLDDAAAVLLPATTNSTGKEFFKPTYEPNGEVVNNVEPLYENEDGNDGNGSEVETFNQYVYKREFYIKSGLNVDINKEYSLKLFDSTNAFNSGTYIIDKEDAGTGFTSLNAVRIALKFEDADASDGYTTTESVVIYEPFSNENTAEGKHAENNVPRNTYGPSSYQTLTLKQTGQGIIDDKELCIICEGIPVKVTMYVWFEGMDDDCENEIALDTIAGQLQFEAEEKND